MTALHPPGEELQDLLDGRLTAVRRSEVETHVAVCGRCRGELDALRWARNAAGWLPASEPPAELVAGVARALDAEDRRAAHPPVRRRFLLPAAAVVGAAAVLTLMLRSSTPADLPGAVAGDFMAYGGTALALDTTSADGPTLERYFARRGLVLPTRVFDLGMMGYHLVGGRVHRLARRPSALFVYRGADGRTLVCEMYEGTLRELPPGGEPREHDGITFQIFRREEGAVTLVFWQEGPVVCVLVSDAPAEQVVQLAYAKALKV